MSHSRKDDVIKQWLLGKQEILREKFVYDRKPLTYFEKVKLEKKNKKVTYFDKLKKRRREKLKAKGK